MQRLALILFCTMIGGCAGDYFGQPLRYWNGAAEPGQTETWATNVVAYAAAGAILALLSPFGRKRDFTLMRRDQQQNPDPNVNAALIVAESTAAAEGTSACERG